MSDRNFQTYEECKADIYNRYKISKEAWIKMKNLYDSLSSEMDVSQVHWVVNCTNDELCTFLFRDKLYLECAIDEGDGVMSGFLIISTDKYPIEKYHCVEYNTQEEARKHILAWYNKEIWNEKENS